jgi:hypothetical protein
VKPVEFAGGAKLESATSVLKYPMILSLSNRFKRLLPEVLGVPGFTGIRIHPGNTIADTEGCLLVGSWRNGRTVTSSRVAMEKLMERLLLDPGPHTIEYRNPF